MARCNVATMKLESQILLDESSTAMSENLTVTS